MTIWEVSLVDFLLVTVFLGGGAAWLTGRATALTWSSWWVLLIYIVLLTAATRFIHFSLFHGSFFLPLSTFGAALYHAGVDFVILMAAAALGRQITRAHQMSSQYGFLFDRASPLGWREKARN
jgi:hypothetical protein